jgi:hypothetical protein
MSSLSDRFDMHYEPWLNFTLIRDAVEAPTLQMVCCLIAARHLPASSRARVTSRLQKLVERIIPNKISIRKPQIIQALLTLSLWSPISTFMPSDSIGGQRLIPSATYIATILKIAEASEKLISVPAGTPAFHQFRQASRLVSTSSEEASIN